MTLPHRGRGPSAGPVTTAPVAPVVASVRPGPPVTSAIAPEGRAADLPRPVTPDAGAVAPPRAGRNVPVAIGVGLVLAAVVIVPLFVYHPVFAAIIALAVGYACYELTTVLAASGRVVPVVPLLVGMAGSYLAAYLRGSTALALGVLLTALALVGWRAAQGDPSAAGATGGATVGAGGPVGGATVSAGDAPGPGWWRVLRGPGTVDLAASLWVLCYVVLLGGFAVLMDAPADGPRRSITFVATVALSDVGGFVAGVLFGRHPLAPVVSPKKSWEGLAGSAVACMVAAGLFLPLLLHTAVWQGVVFGLAMTAAATVGDLAESLVKRDLGVKDMGTLLPGHGGIMDRLDSLLIAAPVAYLLLDLFTRR